MKGSLNITFKLRTPNDHKVANDFQTKCQQPCANLVQNVHTYTLCMENVRFRFFLKKNIIEYFLLFFIFINLFTCIFITFVTLSSLWEISPLTVLIIWSEILSYLLRLPGSYNAKILFGTQKNMMKSKNDLPNVKFNIIWFLKKDSIEIRKKYPGKFHKNCHLHPRLHWLTIYCRYNVLFNKHAHLLNPCLIFCV